MTWAKASAGDADALAQVTWLLWAASRLVSQKKGPVASPAADARMAQLLDVLLEVCPEGLWDIALWTASGLYRFGFKYMPTSSDLRQRLRHEAWRVAQTQSLEETQLSRNCQISHLDDGPFARRVA